MPDNKYNNDNLDEIKNLIADVDVGEDEDVNIDELLRQFGSEKNKNQDDEIDFSAFMIDDDEDEELPMLDLPPRYEPEIVFANDSNDYADGDISLDEVEKLVRGFEDEAGEEPVPEEESYVEPEPLPEPEPVVEPEPEPEPLPEPEPEIEPEPLPVIEPAPVAEAVEEAAHPHGRKHGFFNFGRSHETAQESEIIQPSPEEQKQEETPLEEMSEVDRRREELRRAKRHSDELQNEIASSVDAAMNDKKLSSEAAADRTGDIDKKENSGAEAVPVDRNESSIHISDDLRAFRNNTPDEAAAKAKRAVGYYSWRCIAVFVLAIFAWYNTAAATYQWWQPGFLTYIENPFIFLLVLCAVQIVAMFISISLIADGMLAAIRLNFKAETLISLSCIVNLIYTVSIIVFPAWGGHLPCTAVTLLGLFAGLFARRQRYKGVRWGCRAAARADGYYCSVKGMRDQNGDVKTVYKTEPNLLDHSFMEKLLEEDRAEQLMHYIVPLAIIITLLFAIISSVGAGNASRFMWHWSTLLAASVPCGLMLSRVMPFSSVASKLSRIGVSIMGTSGLRAISTADAAIVRETDLFPTKMVTVNGVKTFSGFTAEKVNLCTLSVLKASGSSLYDAFAASLPGQPMSLPNVEEFEFFETGGMGAYVNGEKVHVGTASFILRMGVRLPEGINLKNSVFVAINLKFAGIFSIKYDVQPSVRRSINYIVKHKIVPVLAVRDFNINEQLVESKFKVTGENIGYPELEERIAYSAIKDTELDEDCAVVAINNLHSYGETIICGKRVHSAERLNIIFGFLALCIGVPLIFYLLFMEAFTVVTPANMFYYALLWLAPVIISALGANRR